MPQVNVLLEFEDVRQGAFGLFSLAAESPAEGVQAAENLLDRVAGFGVELEEEQIPVPMFSEPSAAPPVDELRAFGTAELSVELPSATTVLAARVPDESLEELDQRAGVRVWPNSELTLFSGSGAAPVDCRPFQPGATIEEIQQALGVQVVWEEGHSGEGIVIGIIDEGVNGDVYPVRGGFEGANAPAPGSAPITSHGSMCAADCLVAAPDVAIYDYPFLGVPNSGGALAMFQSVLDQRRLDGTPHLTNNSYGFTGVPSPDRFPKHEIWDPQHPLHRKVREVIVSGAPAFFAAGNCGADCPSGNCDASGIGPGKSIHASNSLEEVITIAAVNKNRTRIGYSSQGPGMFMAEKPDLAAYSHLFANFGQGRPGGEPPPFDNGTSAATPVACGVGALLLGAHPGTSPGRLKQALIASAVDVPAGGWNADIGHGVIHAGGAFAQLP
ncbi:MAG TPA: S8 family serine peptidase [Solirubrobacterales bacterium]|nr:S8 family serine peptidase [Solirubrobacterales bacterium]